MCLTAYIVLSLLCVSMIQRMFIVPPLWKILILFLTEYLNRSVNSDVKEIGNDKLNYKSYKSTLLLFKLNLKSCNFYYFS